MVEIAIPTHGREDIIIEQSLFLLGGLGYNITIFANPKGESRKYIDKIGNKYNIVEIDKFTTMGALRNEILGYYKEGEKILMVDDDIGNLYRIYGKKLLQLTNTEIRELIEQGFGMCESAGYKQWGIYPSSNRMCMKDFVSTSKFIIGCFMGIIKTCLQFDSTVNCKEDYDFSLQNIVTYGGNIRFEGICTDNKYGKTKGGLQEIDRDSANYKDAQRLIKKWGNLVKENPRKEGEILFNIR